DRITARPRDHVIDRHAVAEPHRRRDRREVPRPHDALAIARQEPSAVEREGTESVGVPAQIEVTAAAAIPDRALAALAAGRQPRAGGRQGGGAHRSGGRAERDTAIAVAQEAAPVDAAEQRERTAGAERSVVDRSAGGDGPYDHEARRAAPPLGDGAVLGRGD